MLFKIFFTDDANEDMDKLENNPALSKRFKAVIKALKHLENNPRHLRLNTHKYSTLSGINGEEILRHMQKIIPPHHTEFSGIMGLVKII